MSGMKAILTPKVNGAFDEIENEDSPLSMEERFDNLLQEIIAQAFFIIDRQRRTKQRMTDDEKNLQDDMMYQLRMIEKAFAIAKKQGRIASKPNERFDEQLVGKIKHMKSTIGDIVTTVPSVKKIE